MTQHIELTPAYGRDYRSQAEALSDWHKDKNFKMPTILGGQYVNKGDTLNKRIFPVEPFIYLRYYKLRKVVKV